MYKDDSPRELLPHFDIEFRPGEVTSNGFETRCWEAHRPFWRDCLNFGSIRRGSTAENVDVDLCRAAHRVYFQER